MSPCPPPARPQLPCLAGCSSPHPTPQPGLGPSSPSAWNSISSMALNVGVIGQGHESPDVLIKGVHSD